MLVLVGILALSAPTMWAQDTNIYSRVAITPETTNEFRLGMWVTERLELKKRDPHNEFWPAYSDEIGETGNNITGDKFGYVSEVRNIAKRDNLRYDYAEHVNSSAANMFVDIGGDASREIFVDVLPIEEWEESGRTFLSFFGNVFKNSIGNTEEERENTVSATPQTHNLSREWWKSNYGNGLTAIGIRPFRDKPYAYTEFDVGHIEGRPAKVSLRVYSMLFDSNMTGAPKIELRSIIPTGKRSHVVLGGSFYPTESRSNDHRPKGSIRYESVIFNHVKDVFWSVGLQSTSRGETFAMAMVSIAL